MDIASPRPVTGVLAVLLVDHLPRHRAWAWWRLIRGPAALRGLPGLRFAKVMGSGEGGGFGLRPSGTHQGLLALFDNADQAQAFLEGPLAQAYRARARQWWSGLMAVDSARGSWDGMAWGATPAASATSARSARSATSATPAQSLPALQAAKAPDGSTPGAVAAPIVVLTRASIRPRQVWSFWRQSPAAEQALVAAPGCTLAMGLGEAPLLRQCTFSVWRDLQAMNDYAQGGAHGQAARQAWRAGHFSEAMFVRMRLLASAGEWPAPAVPAAPSAPLAGATA